MQLYTKILLGMGIGVALGFLIGPNSAILPQDGVQLSKKAVVRVEASESATPAFLARGLKRAKLVQESASGFHQIEWSLQAPDLLRLQKSAKTDAQKTLLKQTKPGAQLTGYVAANSAAIKTYARIGQSAVDATEWLGRLFLALIKMVVVPLVFFSLVVGVASLGDFRRLGRMGGRTIGLFMVTTVVALVIGVGLTNIIEPGNFISLDDKASLLASYEDGASKTVSNAAQAPSMVDQIIAIVPSNPIKSLATGNMLQIIFFALMLGIALTMLSEERSKPVVQILDNLNEAMVMLVHIAMKLAPIGVAALLFKVVGTTGLSVLLALGVYGFVVVLGLLLHLSLTYGLIVKLGARLPFLGFLNAIKPALLLAFSTSSSSATLPVTKECVEDNLNVSNQVSSFVLPLGATVNMDGTALYQGVAAIFIAQIYGLDLTIADQATIVTSATLASVGAAGVPGAGMITLAMVLTAVGVPTEGLALVLGVDRLLDMFRTTTNVVGDSAATVFMARLEGENLQFFSSTEDARNPKKGFEGRLEASPHSVVPEQQD